MDFDFIDIYRVGNSLIKITQKKLKKGLKETFNNNDDWKFCGDNWDAFIEKSFLEPPKCQDEAEFSSYNIINKLEMLNLWNERVDLFLTKRLEEAILYKFK